MRSKLTIATTIALGLDGAALIATGTRGLAIPLHLFNSLLAIGVVAGLGLLLPPLLVGVVDEAATERASDNYLQGIRDGAARRG